MLNIPTYARSTVDGYFKNGAVPVLNQRTELTPERFHELEQRVQDEFTSWSQADESAKDKLKGVPGEVYVDGPSSGFERVSLQKDRLVRMDCTPEDHYGAEYTHILTRTADSAEILTVGHFIHDEMPLGPYLAHLDLKTGQGYELHRA